MGAEIGDGTGSVYPGSLDTNAQPEVNSPAAGKTKARAEVVEDLASSIVALETELGVDPAGGKTTVVARLDTEHNSDGTHDDSLVCVLSGVQTHTGAKTFGVTTFSDVATFNKEIVAQSGVDPGIWGFSGTATEAATNRVVTTSGGQIIPDGGIDAGGTGTYLKTKVIEIGSWDMDATETVIIAHGLGDEAIIRTVTVLIRQDTPPSVRSLKTLPYPHPSATGAEGFDIDQNNVDITRGPSGFFDNTSFDDTSFNRGWIVIDYV